MSRRVVAIVAVLCTLCLACTDSGAATSRGELGSLPQATATAESFLNDVLIEPGVVIAATPTPEGPRPLVVATLLAESGVLRPLDGPALAGIVAEAARLNEEGGVLGREVVVVRHNTDSRVSLAERIMLRLVENPPDLLIVSCDVDFIEPVLATADEAGILTISPCADDPRYLTGALGARNFTMGAPAEPRGALAAQAAIDAYGNTAIVLRDVTSPEALAFCDGFERAFRELGGSVVYRDEFSYDTLEPVQDRLAERGRPSGFITVCSHVPGDIDAAPSIILILRTLGFQAPILAGSSVDELGWFSSVPTLGEMTFISWSSVHGNDPDDRVNQLVRQAQQNGNTPGAGISTILGAEALEAWARAAESARDASPERVAAALGSFNREPFATGFVSFIAGARMDIGRTYRILRVVDGELSVVSLEASED